MSTGRIANFSHWAPSGDANAAWTTAVDADGQAWTQGPGGVWVSQDGRRQTVAENNNVDPKASAMTTPSTAQQSPSSEVTGIRSAVAMLEQIAAAHGRIAGSEGFLGSLRLMEVGEEDQQRFLDAQQASRNAEQAWALAAKTVAEHNLPVGEAYSVSPGAANKQANTNE